MTNGNNIVFNIANSGTISLIGAKGKTINIYPNSNPTPPTVAPAVTPQGVIKTFMGVLDTVPSVSKDALDKAVSVATGGYFTNIDAAIDRMTLDCANATNADTFLREKCGIILGNADTGAITGSDADGSSVKTAQSVVQEYGTLDNFTGDSFTTNDGLKVYLGKFPDYNGTSLNRASAISFESLDYKQKYIWQAFKTWWADGALSLIAESYGDNYGFGYNSSATVKEMYFGFFEEEPNSYGAATLAWHANLPAGYLTMAVNFHDEVYATLTDGDNPDGENDNRWPYLDRMLAHEMTHAVMMANINGYGNLPQFIKEGMAELTHGADDDRQQYIRNLSTQPDNLKLSLSLTDTGTGKIGKVDAYAGGYMFLRYLAKQGSEHYPNANSSGQVSSSASVSESESANALTVANKLMTVAKDFFGKSIRLTDYASVSKVDATALTKGIQIIGNTKANSISAGSGNDTVFANVENDTLHGGAGNDVLCGEAGNDKIYGDSGDDTLSGGTGNDTLTGGDGKDLFVHVADNDIITDYKEEDKIQLVEGNIVSKSINGSNLVLDIGRYGSITVTDGASKNITVIDGDGNETIISPAKIKKYTNSSAAKVTLASTYDVADATARTKAIRIVGNAKDNTILGGTGKDTLYGKDGNDYLAGNAGNDKLYGQNGADTLWGGTGNDTLTGGDSNDLFVYSTGNDVIADYAAGDKISISGSISSSSVKGSDATFKIGSSTLTVKKGKGKEIAFINADGTERTIIGGAYLADNGTKSAATRKITQSSVVVARIRYTAKMAMIILSATRAPISSMVKTELIRFGAARATTAFGEPKEPIRSCTIRVKAKILFTDSTIPICSR